ncbi:MAG: hypothetical protein H6727_01480 [Myxococcales bacterium]|nr:hypothetical protein [Myxococcales bacterium]
MSEKKKTWSVWLGLWGLLIMGCGTNQSHLAGQTMTGSGSFVAPQVSAEAEQDIDKLAYALTHDKRTKREKSWAIFRWITQNIAYDAKGFFAGRYGRTDALSVLRTRRSVCAGYANLFYALGNSAGLEVMKVYGTAKGISGASKAKPSLNHAWNAVRFDGKWNLIDSTWGAGSIQGTRFVRRFEPFYFATPPAHLIYTHYPSQSKWQLLPQAVSYQNFLGRPRLYPKFFRVGLRPQNFPQKRLRATGALHLPLEKPFGVDFLFRLSWGGQRFVASRYQHGVLHAQLPYSGLYKLNLYARTLGGKLYHAVGHFEIYVHGTKVPKDLRPTFYRHCFRRVGRFMRNQCKLQSPVNGAIPSGRKQTIQVYIPRAKKVAVKQDGKFVHFRPMAGYPGWYAAQLLFKEAGPFIIYAKPDENSRIYQGALSLIVY